MKNVLFVCTANVCRSPMAVGIFEALAVERRLDVRVASAGVAALAGKPAANNARRVIEELGLDIGEHRARQVSEEMVRDAELVLTMTPEHRDSLRRNYEDFRGKIHALPEYASGDADLGIADPYGRELGAYRASARELLWHMERAVDRFEREQERTEVRPNAGKRAERSSDRLA